MKNLATLKRLNNQVVIAMQAARLAVYENLKELAVEVPVRSDEDCEDCDERKGLYVYGPGKYYSLSEYRIDAVKAGEKSILCHYNEWNEHEADDWQELEEFYDCENILECIQWPDEVPDGEAQQEQNKVIERYDAIRNENKELVSCLIPKAIKNEQTIYGELCDWLRDYHNDLTLQESDLLAHLLLGDMVIHHPDWISRIKPNKLMVLCHYDEDDQEYSDVDLVVSKHQFDTDKERVREAIEGLWELDQYDENDLNELRECISDLLKGENGYFGIEYYWKEIDAIL
jgi:hypothetical protein